MRLGGYKDVIRAKLVQNMKQITRQNRLSTDCRTNAVATYSSGQPASDASWISGHVGSLPTRVVSPHTSAKCPNGPKLQTLYGTALEPQTNIREETFVPNGTGKN